MGFAIRWAVGQFHMVLSTLRWWLPHVVVWGAQSPLLWFRGSVAQLGAASAAGDWNINEALTLVVPHYPLVNVYITMENHHVEWENPL